MKSLDFVLNGVIKKIFVVKSNEVVNDCSSFFYCVGSDAIFNRKLRFLSKLKYSDNLLLLLVTNKIGSELSTVAHSILLVTMLSLLLFFPRCSLCIYHMHL